MTSISRLSSTNLLCFHTSMHLNQNAELPAHAGNNAHGMLTAATKYVCCVQSEHDRPLGTWRQNADRAKAKTLTSNHALCLWHHHSWSLYLPKRLKMIDRRVDGGLVVSKILYPLQKSLHETILLLTICIP